MNTLLNLLIAEDVPDDVELVLAELRRAGFDPHWKRVQTETDFLSEIKKIPDLIISDYAMPSFTGLQAAKLLRTSGLDIPFILISGMVGEEIAVEAMQFGATDYLLKDRITRLGSAVKRALREHREHREHEHANELLRLLKSAVLQANESILITDAELNLPGPKIVFVNPAFTRMTGYTAEEIIGQTPRIMQGPRTDKTVLQRLRKNLEDGEEFDGATVQYRKDGTEYYQQWRIGPICDEAGKVTHYVAIQHDITARKKAEEELLWKTAFLEAQVDSSMDGIVVVDNEGKKILQNQRMNELWKIPAPIALNDTNAVQMEFVAHRTKNPQQFIAKVKHLNLHPDEVSRDEIDLVDGTILDHYSSPVRDKAGKYYGRIWTFRDLTHHRKLETQYRQSQKMEAFGQLAGGVAHDFNNILQVIQLQAGLLKIGSNLTLQQLDFASEIEKAAQRAANLTRQLLLFSRQQNIQPQDLNLKEVVDNIMKMLQRTLGEQIHLQFKMLTEPLFIHADPGMIDQILLNLTVNARDAMPKGGQILIETTAVEFDEATAIQTPQARAGTFACLRVTDTGHGIAPEILPRIFEPFFTTKELGKGTGLGLATIFGIVQQHKGWINVQSEIGNGTTFQIYLPRLTSPPDKKVAWASLASIRGGPETILLVEDEPAVRNAVCAILSRLGYRIIQAISGVEALAAWKEHGHEVNLLLTDLVMPGGITGKELGEQLLKQNPKLKIIYTSGYCAETADQDFLLEEGVNFLNKPCEARKLAQTIRNRLDQNAG